MLIHFVAAIGVLGLPTVVPGPDMAVVTAPRSPTCPRGGPAAGLRTVGGINRAADLGFREPAADRPWTDQG